MKIREMDVYFTVPVDRAVLAACRKEAGYSSAAAFDAALKSKGYRVGYIDIEYPTRGGKSGERRIRGDAAELIAAELGAAPDTIFPAFSASRAAAVRNVEENYYKPFTTIEGRNAAIVEAMDVAKYAALKYAYYLDFQNPTSFFDKEEALCIAYEALVEAADKALKKGIRKGVSFERHVCRVVKNRFGQMRLTITRRNNGAFIVSYDDLPTGETASTFNLEDEAIKRDEVRQAIRSLSDASEEKKQDDVVQELEAQLAAAREERKRIKRIRSALDEFILG